MRYFVKYREIGVFGIADTSLPVHVPLSALQMDVLLELFRDYVIIGGMPEVVDTIASLDEEAQEDLRANKNLGTYKGAIYGNIVVKQGYRLFYYHSERPVLGMDFLSGMPSLWFRWK